ncbi:MAG: 3'(2'),5'-bisphosphate nucleotidase CysQ family protein [Candidatus Nanoarchaeia archaeon]
MEKYSKELKILLDALREAGREVMRVYEGEHEVEIKSDDSPITKADRISHRILSSRFSVFNHGIVSEEGEDIYSERDLQWVIDPLDGTSDFIQKTGEFSLMVALLENKKPVLGSVYAPALDCLWYASQAQGAYLISSGTEKKISVSPHENLANYRFVISRNHFREQDKAVADSLGINSFKKMGSVGVKFCRIAQGDAELCVYTTDKLGVWDTCAPHIILKEAGGNVFDINGGEPVYDLFGKKMKNGFIGTNGKNKDSVLASIKDVIN